MSSSCFLDIFNIFLSSKNFFNNFANCIDSINSREAEGYYFINGQVLICSCNYLNNSLGQAMFGVYGTYNVQIQKCNFKNNSISGLFATTSASSVVFYSCYIMGNVDVGENVTITNATYEFDINILRQIPKVCFSKNKRIETEPFIRHQEELMLACFCIIEMNSE